MLDAAAEIAPFQIAVLAFRLGILTTSLASYLNY